MIAAVRELVRYFPARSDARAQRSKRATLALLEGSARPCARDQFEPGHLTSSALVLSPDRGKLLLVFHEKIGRWLQPGGHVEPHDRSILDTARREVREETGVAPLLSVAPVLVGVDVHEIPATAREPAHLHHDLIWRFVAASELLDGACCMAAWVRVADVPSLSPDVPLLANLARALAPSHPERAH